MNANITPRQEQAVLALQDAEVAEELAAELKTFHFDVVARGSDSQIHLEKAKGHARDLIKRLVNYI